MISLLVSLIVAVVLLWAAGQLLAVLNVPEPLKTIIWVVLVVLVVLWLVQALFGTPVLPRWR